MKEKVICAVLRLKCHVREGWRDNRGMGTVEVIMIIVVLISLVLLFKDQITSILQSLFKKVTNNVNKL